MGVTYWLVNHTKRECIGFSHVAASTKKELAGNVIAASITTWYMLEHRDDEVNFLSSDDEWPDVGQYEEVTDRVIDDLIDAGIFEDDGREQILDDEPELYWRKLRNVWMVDPSGHK